MEQEIDLIQDYGKIKRQKDIHHHGPKHIPNLCHLRDPPHFSLVTNFNRIVSLDVSLNKKKVEDGFGTHVVIVCSIPVSTPAALGQIQSP